MNMIKAKMNELTVYKVVLRNDFLPMKVNILASDRFIAKQIAKTMRTPKGVKK
ncbi:hypothetical protein AB1I77_25445 [Bacillus paranthracis]|uniref:hypothetical protein n=2 Tax=Bacillus cereus group TaxID=86661 RepID=UPI001649D520|nr:MULTISPECIES: hypothetical protein [Bacillus cereus group]MCC2459690.1 hypothetical protein [Bacillus mobilis]MCU5514731.1 hypothetical protein [Bacillus wiedmannii]HDR7875922.1 hypothetical protein [Bacillus mobilis]